MRRVLLIVFLCGIGLISDAQDNYSKLDYYLYLFAKNIEWPDSVMQDKFYIGIIGNSTANMHLEVLQKNEKIKGLPVEIKIFQTPDDVSFCNLLFIPEDYSSLIDKIAAKMSINTLMVTEAPGQAFHGSGINIFWGKKGESLRYELNTAAFRKAGLRLLPELRASSSN